MSDIAIRVEDLSKAYRIGLKEQIPDTLVGAMASWMRSPLRNFHNLRRLSTFGTNDDAEDVVWALKDVSFDVKEGEVIGIIGRNGAGKSTLLKILSRITDPTSGEATIRGRVSSLLEVGTGFHPELTGRENIYMNGTILGMSKREIDRKFDEIVDFSGVDKFLDTPIKRYSSGMKVRLAFSVAAHLEPEVLVIDEVLAVGDIGFQQKCLGKMRQVSQSGRTVLFVSHDLLAIERLCKRAIYLRNGSIHGEGRAAAIVGVYRSDQQPNAESVFQVAPGSPITRVEVYLVSNTEARSTAPIDQESLRIRIGVWSCRPILCPRIDLSFHRADGAKLAGVLADRLSLESHGSSSSWQVSYEVRMEMLAPMQFHVDVGVRQQGSHVYDALGERVLHVDYRGAAPPFLTRDSLVIPAIRGWAELGPADGPAREKERECRHFHSAPEEDRGR